MDDGFPILVSAEERVIILEGLMAAWGIAMQQKDNPPPALSKTGLEIYAKKAEALLNRVANPR